MGKKRGRKKWSIGERIGGLLPGDRKPEGRFSFPLRELYRSAELKNLSATVPTKAELDALEADLNLSDDQEWALDFLTTQLRYAVLRGDTETLAEIAAGIEYRKRFSDRWDEASSENDLEWRLYRVAIAYRCLSGEHRYPDRRTAKRIAIQEWIETETANRKMSAQEAEDFEDRIKALHWARAFKNLAKFGLYTEPGRPGAPRKKS